MREFILDSKFNIIFIIIIAWFVAQCLKVLLGVFREKRFNFNWFVGTGGMPSSHAAAVSAMATSIGVHNGVDSPLFAIAMLFAIVVLFDAQGVRRASGKQAELLNKILDDIYWKKRIKEDRLKELLGHTPVEVIAGTALGILIGLFFSP
ncbi:MAG: divergent PAP2 family protein [Candidatus Omnitrophica bacterium]|nr:divergent PAP2 family protein [Candidatus Omnitrophota bacterium]